jgi:hypothetical protein
MIFCKNGGVDSAFQESELVILREVCVANEAAEST